MDTYEVIEEIGMGMSGFDGVQGLMAGISGPHVSVERLLCLFRLLLGRVAGLMDLGWLTLLGMGGIMGWKGDY